MDELKKERIALEVIKTIKSQFDNLPERVSDNRNSPFHEAFLKAFQIEEYVTNELDKIIKRFFENIALILCDGEKREFDDLLINPSQQSSINEIMISLKNKERHPSLIKENELLFNNLGHSSLNIQNFTADVYFEDDEKIVAVELKTVKPNSGIFNKEKEKILNAKAGLKNKFEEKDILFYLGFPFDPLDKEKCGFDKNRFFDYGIDFKKFFDPDEVLVASELWDFLSEEKNTMQAILDIINSISMPDFMEKFNFINGSNNFHLNPERYKSILNEWFLMRELRVTENISLLLDSSQKEKSIKRLLRQSLFDKEAKYREYRINILSSELSK